MPDMTPHEASLWAAIDHAVQTLRSDRSGREIMVGTWKGCPIVVRNDNPAPRGLDAYRKPVENR